MRISGQEKTQDHQRTVSDRLPGLPIMMSAPKSGEHNDVHDIEEVMKMMFEDIRRANISIDGLFLNDDAGFDCDVLLSCLDRNGVVVNICISKRRNDSIFVDELTYAERYSVERTNAWIDRYRTLLNRFDTTVSSWESWNYLEFAVLLLKKISRKQKV